MKSSYIRKAYQSAEEELGKDKIEQMKGLVKNLFERIEEEKKSVIEHKRLLRLHLADLSDFKTGKLSRVLERQQKDDYAKKNSIVDVKDILSAVPQSDRNTTYYTNTQLIRADNVGGVSDRYFSSMESLPACKDYRYQWWTNNVASGTYVTFSGRAYYI